MNSIFIHFNVPAALFFFRDSNKGLFVDNCFMMIGKQIPCSLLALRRVAHENCGCSRTTAIFFIAEKRIDRSSTPFRLSCWRRYGTRFEFVDNTDNTIGKSLAAFKTPLTNLHTDASIQDRMERKGEPTFRWAQTVDKSESTVIFHKEKRISMSNI